MSRIPRGGSAMIGQNEFTMDIDYGALALLGHGTTILGVIKEKPTDFFK